MQNQKITKRTTIPQENRIKAELQKEIGSRCPFCPSEDVGHFEIHHIDENPKNHNYNNLILLCRHCHSKFTKKEWSLNKARLKKDELCIKPNLRDFESNPKDQFDYTCYSMQEGDGRKRQEHPNGSRANIQVLDDFHFRIVLIQAFDGRRWKGDLLLENKNYGILTFKYEEPGQIEMGRRECHIDINENDDYREDIFFFKPLSDLKDYGNELMLRKTMKTNNNI